MKIRESDHFILAMKLSKPVEQREWHIVDSHCFIHSPMDFDQTETATWQSMHWMK